LEANQQAVSFFITLTWFRDLASVQPLTLENGQTQEKLVIDRKTEGQDYVSISRCPMGTNVEKWIEEIHKHPYIGARKIEFLHLVKFIISK
jgi:hypothetical protein